MALGAQDHSLGPTVAARHRTSSILLLTGLLAEALPVLQRSGKHFRDLPEFQQEILPILRDPEVAILRARYLTPLRNQAVFHNDAEVSKVLSTLAPSVPQIFAEGDSAAFFGAHYPLADVAAFVYVINRAGEAGNPEVYLSNSLGATVALAMRVCSAIDAVVQQALSSFGLVAEGS